MTRCWGVVPAAGVGERMEINRPKQYIEVAGKHIIEHSIAPLLQCKMIDAVVVALRKKDKYWQHTSISDDQRISVCEGGVSRAQSVRNALAQLKADAEDWVVVHDAVRPCLKTDTLKQFIKSTWDNHPIGAIMAIAITDSIKHVQHNPIRGGFYIVSTLSRNDLWFRSATPQMFRYRLLCDALDKALPDGFPIDDEAVAMMRSNHEVDVLLGDAQNIKITHREDLEYARRWLSYKKR